MIRMAHLVSGSLFGRISFFWSGREALGDANFLLAISKEGSGEIALVGQSTVRPLLELEIGLLSTNQNKLASTRETLSMVTCICASRFWTTGMTADKRPYDTYKMAFPYR